jgi:hypothetical protein
MECKRERERERVRYSAEFMWKHILWSQPVCNFWKFSSHIAVLDSLLAIKWCARVWEKKCKWTLFYVIDGYINYFSAYGKEEYLTKKKSPIYMKMYKFSGDFN